MRFQVFIGVNGQWYWHMKSRNGRKIATSGEGFKRRPQCIASIRLMVANAPDAVIPVDPFAVKRS